MIGIGLRGAHFEEVVSTQPEVDFFEIISENHMTGFGRHRLVIEELRPNYEFSFHGVSLNLGSPDPLDETYLVTLKNFVSDFEPFLVSDHLCWSGAHSHFWYDLLPLPFTAAVLDRTVSKIQEVQDFLGRRIAIENISTYLQFASNEMTEWEFTKEVLQQADCDLLLDVNNLYINSFNHSFDLADFIDLIPADRVKQIHLAGHDDRKDFLFDTHDRSVSDPVWDLYRLIQSSFGSRPTLIEWDNNLPPLASLVAEAKKIEKNLHG